MKASKNKFHKMFLQNVSAMGLAKNYSHDIVV